jgi:hypothetical protein
MLGVDDPATFLKIRDTLLAQCELVEELDRREIVRVWRDWHAAYPLAPKPHGSILKSDIVSRLCVVLRSPKGRHALAAYEQQGPGDLLVLCVDALVGWSCKVTRVPALNDLDATLIVTPKDFAWTFGVHEMWKRASLYGGPVFVEPEMLPEALL